MITLYTYAQSGNCHKVRLFLNLLGLPFETRELNLAQGEHRTEQMLALNPLGQVPVLSDGEKTFADSQAILVYLARRYGAEHWLPLDPEGLAKVTRWLAAAASEVQFGPAAARVSVVFRGEAPTDEVSKRSIRLLQAMSRTLALGEWLTGEQASIADVAMFPYLSVAEHGLIDLAPFPRVRDWLARVAALPGFVPMPDLSPEMAARRDSVLAAIALKAA
ncbi:glutathione S-transferase family protein [Niveibacterium sp. 24ML]|uniref:glutathione S-transferase family protein n=1 Tax=Niveibacterium sp. 24ML TaxID=2985512 RepID=UPI00226FE583|nr:glutathione S-transferase family protein [Niveibacterium sp. 24ML]MCX9155718.1 glutathione S-transferase family protein [Niveibacterium sp. 24ML]